MYDEKITEAVIAEITKEIPNLRDEENQYTLDKIDELGGPNICYGEIVKSAACLVKLLIDVRTLDKEARNVRPEQNTESRQDSPHANLQGVSCSTKTTQTI